MEGQAWGQQLLGFQESWGIGVRSLPAWTAPKAGSRKTARDIPALQVRSEPVLQSMDSAIHPQAPGPSRACVGGRTDSMMTQSQPPAVTLCDEARSCLLLPPQLLLWNNASASMHREMRGLR